MEDEFEDFEDEDGEPSEYPACPWSWRALGYHLCLFGRDIATSVGELLDNTAMNFGCSNNLWVKRFRKREDRADFQEAVETDISRL